MGMTQIITAKKRESSFQYLVRSSFNRIHVATVTSKGKTFNSDVILSVKGLGEHSITHNSLGKFCFRSKEKISEV